jgi:hypothetical protein
MVLPAMPRARAAVPPALGALALIVLAGLLVRLAHNDYGLPYVYSADEGSHFTNRAVAMFGGDPNPGYFQNPSAFTYVIFGVLRLREAVWPLGKLPVPAQFSVDPVSVWVTARSTAAVLCMLGVVAVFETGRRLFGVREGIAAAAVLAFAFLPVAYSRVAVTDVGTFLPVAASVGFSALALDRGRQRDLVLAGATAGLAIGFKYTAGLLLLPVIAAGVVQARRAPRKAAVGLGLALACAVLVFLVTTPYFLFDFETARRQIVGQAQTAGAFGKVGQAGDSGVGYYAGSLTWGLGWGATLMALAGAVLLTRRDPRRAAVLCVFPLALFAYLSGQSRFFGRWLLPVYPVLALLAGVGIAWAATTVAARLPRGAGARPAAGVAVLGLVLLAVLAQPVAADLRTASVLGHTDTREVARDFLTARYPPSARVVIEPAVPSRYYRLVRRRRSLPPSRKQFVRGFIRDNRESRLDYATTLRPQTVDLYRRTGFCTVMTLSLLRGRAERDGIPGALAYYRRLERESKLELAVDPYWPGATRVPFNFDRSYNYYPSSYARPGPEVRIYHLTRCRQRYGPVRRGTGTPAAASS